MKKGFILGIIFGLLLVGCQTNRGDFVTGDNVDTIETDRENTEQFEFEVIENTGDNIIYVNSNQSGSGDGQSWSTAFTSLQEGLAIASEGDEIWVAKGIYYPSETDRMTSFSMVDGVNIYGGFKGTELKKEDRDWEFNETVLSGNIGDKNEDTDNSENVVIAANAVIDGFIISDGYNMKEVMDSSSEAEDLYSDSLEKVLSGNGGGIVVWEVAPIIRNCKIINCQSLEAGGVNIGGTGELEGTPTFINCYFGSNYSKISGGGLSIEDDSDPVFVDCIFQENICEEKGGAIYNDLGSEPLFENCLFIKNRAFSGGAMRNDGGSNPIISNCTFSENAAFEAGAALYEGSGAYNDPVVINSIIWGNQCEGDVADIYDWNESNTKVSYSIVEEGFVGEDVLVEDPKFVDPDNLNFDLKEQSVALKASSKGERIGFNASLLDTRTDEDYSLLISNLYTIERNEESTAMDLTNPVSEKDAFNTTMIIYVAPDGNGKGSSFDDAFGSLQEAINYGNAKYLSVNIAVDIYVQKGIYYTGTTRDDSFVLREGVNLYGGFNGTEKYLKERNYEAYETILSGDIGIENEVADNSYHVLIGADNVKLDGFTITGGYADGEKFYDDKGGGLLNYYAGNRVGPDYEPTLGFDIEVVNCHFEDNYAVEGAASYTYHGGNPEYTNCTFGNNLANYGGAVVDRAGTNGIYNQCLFVNNIATYKGGAVFVDYGSMSTFYDCEFYNNKAGKSGGGIYIIDRASQAINNTMDFRLIDSRWKNITDIDSSVYVENCIFEQNTAGLGGGGIYIYENCYGMIVNSNFTNNKAGISGNAVGVLSGGNFIIDDKSNLEND